MAQLIKKILITGSSGTIGTRLFERLLEEGYEVFGADIVPNIWSEKINQRTTIVDLRDKAAVMKDLPKDVDMLIHLAANARVYNLVLDPSLARDNFEMTFNTLEFARENQIKKVIFSSSREVYGNSDQVTHSENDAHLDFCESPYTASKMGGEALFRAYQNCYGIDFITFRFSNVYGMYDKSDRVVPLFILLCKSKKDLVVFGEGKLLDFTYIDDCIDGIILTIKDFERVKNQIYNLAYGEGTSIVDVARMVQTCVASENRIIVEKNRTGEVVRYIADISKAKNNFNYQPRVSIELGIQKATDWYLKNLYRD